MEWRLKRLADLYEERCCDIDEALERIKPGSKIFIGTACAEPQFLVRNLSRFPQNIADTEVLHLVSLNVSPCTDEKFRGMFRLNTFFIGRAARAAVGQGQADYTPIFLSEIPKIIKRGRLHIDVALVQVSPPDPFGNCSLGMSVETVKAAVEHAGYVVAQVNPRMPRTLGDSFVHVSDFGAIVEHDEPVIEYDPEPMDEVADRIGYYVSRLVPNGATIQAGIGGIPNAVLKHLQDKQNLGVHTEMFSDGLVDLYEAGVVTGARKSSHPGKIVAAFCMGTRRLYDTIDNNPDFEFHPTDYVSDPRTIAQNDNMVAINSALEIDLTGQVCADSLGHKFYSGIGGQADFIRGAALATNGRPIIAMRSTARNGEVSRVVSVLSSGAGVVTTRGDVHYVVTEHGIAYLHGKSIRERAMALIHVADPGFRGQLLAEAKELNYIYKDQRLPPRDAPDEEKYRYSYMLRDGREIRVRPIRAVDEDELREFHYNLREQDIYARFMGVVRTLPHEKAQAMVVVDYDEKFALVGWHGDEADEDIVCVGRWFLDRGTNLAEIAITVHPAWQGFGIGTFMFETLTGLARERGIAGFTAEVLATNRRVMKILAASGFNVDSRLEDGVFSVAFTFDDRAREAPP